MKIPDVDYDNTDEDLQRNAGNQEREDKVVELVTLPPDVEQQLEFGNLRHCENRDEGALGLGLRLLEFTVTGQELQEKSTVTKHVLPSVPIHRELHGTSLIELAELIAALSLIHQGDY